MTVALELQPCLGNRSGVGTYAYELAKRLKSGDGMEFVGNVFNLVGREKDPGGLAGITIPVRENRLMSYGVYRRIWNGLPIGYDSFFPKADLNIFFDYVIPPRGVKRAITTVHDMGFTRYPETVAPRNLKRLREGVARSLEESVRIITVSEFSKREIVELTGAPEEKIEVIYNAPSVTVSRETVSKEPPACDRVPYILFVGTIEPRKNLVRLIRAFETLKKERGIPHKLILAGGRGWRNEDIFRAAEKSPYREDIVFKGYVGPEDKDELYRHASVFVFPSIYEGFGIPPLEAMAHGCPVVASNTASLPEVTGDAAEPVAPMDGLSVVEGIWRVLSDRAYAEDLIRRGYKQIEKFSWAASAERLRAVCASALGIG